MIKRERLRTISALWVLLLLSLPAQASKLHDLAKSGDVAGVTAALDEGAAVDEIGGGGHGALHRLRKRKRRAGAAADRPRRRRWPARQVSANAALCRRQWQVRRHRQAAARQGSRSKSGWRNRRPRCTSPPTMAASNALPIWWTQARRSTHCSRVGARRSISPSSTVTTTSWPMCWITGLDHRPRRRFRGHLASADVGAGKVAVETICVPCHLAARGVSDPSGPICGASSGAKAL